MFKGCSAILTLQNVWIFSNIITSQLYQKCAELTQPHLQGFSVVKPIFFWGKLITIDVMLSVIVNEFQIWLNLAACEEWSGEFESIRN